MVRHGVDTGPRDGTIAVAKSRVNRSQGQGALHKNLRRFCLSLVLGTLVGCVPFADIDLSTVNYSVAPRLPPLFLTTARTEFWHSSLANGQKPIRLAKTGARKTLHVLEPTVRNGYVWVQLDGGIEVKGLARVRDLGVMACTPGPVGAFGYVGAGNLVHLAGALDDPKSVRIADHALVPARPWTQGMRYGDQYTRVPVEGDLPRDRLCANVPPPRHAGTDADPFVGHGFGEVDLEDFPPDAREVDIPAGVTLALLSAPDGPTWLTRPAETYGFVVVRIAQQRTATGLWDQVALGGGPYVVGWTPARPVRQPSEGGLALLGGLLGGSIDIPFSLQSAALAKLPLHTLPAGTQIQQLGQPFALLKRQGWARAGDLRDGWQYVFVAVDGDVMVEGWVRPEALKPIPVTPGVK